MSDKESVEVLQGLAKESVQAWLGVINANVANRILLQEVLDCLVKLQITCLRPQEPPQHFLDELEIEQVICGSVPVEGVYLAEDIGIFAQRHPQGTNYRPCFQTLIGVKENDSYPPSIKLPEGLAIDPKIIGFNKGWLPFRNYNFLEEALLNCAMEFYRRRLIVIYGQHDCLPKWGFDDRQ